MRRDDTRPTRGIEARRTVAGGSALVVLILVLMAFAALQGRPVFGQLLFEGAGAVTPSPPPSIDAGTAPPDVRDQDPAALAWLGVVLGILVAIALAALLISGLVVLLRRLWRDRPLRVRAGVQLQDAMPAPDASDPAADAPVVRAGIAGALDAITAIGRPHDAIVAAWVGLEQTAARAGQSRGASETAGELAVRILSRHRASAAEVTALLRLYEDVRFGGATASERDRAEAARLLRRIEEAWR
ncbi:DUF4129 domain-containing protein [Microbacterium resistens]|uniref:DUF4129 domain-containing protein n=1 Tax=Microbacterium resistens TaxID=156977 RepID=A0ABY3RTL9_9MICO|nr:DUF4129 domain-containing protein [Microbacterium resistens]UGS27147.1 DUF4129 domain-containing protein [Microbacterium resistens]